jgi:hypothetical protein
MQNASSDPSAFKKFGREQLVNDSPVLNILPSRLGLRRYGVDILDRPLKKAAAWLGAVTDEMLSTKLTEGNPDGYRPASCSPSLAFLS